MTIAWAAVGTVMAASICCIGPVVGALAGAGALGVAAVRVEPARPYALAATAALLGVAFYRALRPDRGCPESSTCRASRLKGVSVLLCLTLLALLLASFPYYVEFLL